MSTGRNRGSIATDGQQGEVDWRPEADVFQGSAVEIRIRLHRELA